MSILFFVIAFVYASAGFGGGSMYLALLSSFSPTTVLSNKIHGLTCNTTVTFQGSIQWSFHHKSALIQGWRILLVSAVACSTTAYFFKSEGVLQWVMSFALISAGVALLIQERLGDHYLHLQEWQLLIIASIIGCVAGMTGIGGGIYLSPILYLCRWNQPKMIATLCAYLILLNSLLSLIIIIYSLQKPIEIHWEWPLLALLGGILGSRLGIQILNQKQMKTVTALILVIVGAQLFLKQIV